MKLKYLCIAGLLTATLLYCNHAEHHYTRYNCTVVKVNNTSVTVEDPQGYRWEFEGEGYQINDIVDLQMYDNCSSSNKTDDIIKGVIKQ